MGLHKNVFHVFTGENGEVEVDFIDYAGSVTPMQVVAQTRDLEPGIYSLELELIEADPPPDAEDDA